MTHPSRSNHIETNRPGAIAKDPVCSHITETKFLLFINNWLWSEKQFYQFSKIQMPILAKSDFYHLFSIFYKKVMKNPYSGRNLCCACRRHPQTPVSGPPGQWLKSSCMPELETVAWRRR